MLTNVEPKTLHRRPFQTSYPAGVLTVFLILTALAWAVGWNVQSHLLGGGLDAPGTESYTARQALADNADGGGMPLVVELGPDPDSVDSSRMRTAAAEVTAILQRDDTVRDIASYWADPANMAMYRSSTGDSGLITAIVDGNDATAPEAAHALAETIAAEVTDIPVRVGGQSVMYHDVIAIAETDLLKVELIAAPVTAVILYFVFGSIVSALLPLLIAGFAIGLTNALLAVLNEFTSVSVFAASLSTPLCLALAIDYSLLMLTRYREEAAAGDGYTRPAIDRALGSAGRTVLYSGAIIAPSIASLFFFPVYFLQSLAAAGLMAVLASVLGAVMLLPAVLAVLGPRVNNGRFTKSDRGLRPADALSTKRWMRIAAFSTRHSVAVVVGVSMLLAMLALPMAGIKFGSSDDRALSTSVEARTVGDHMRTDYPINAEATVTVVFDDTPTLATAELSEYLRQLSLVEHVVSASAAGIVYQHGVLRATIPDARRVAVRSVSIPSTEQPFTAGGRAQLDELRAVPAPAAVKFAGLAAQNRDNLAAIAHRVPYAIGLIAVASLLLVGLMTRSILLPLKSLFLNVLSLTASFGALVWIFQDGGLGGLGTTSPGFIAAHVPPLIFCVAFGLSMDYEIFLLSRIREEWCAIGENTREANREAVIRGIGFTGRTVTLAATVMMVVFLALLVSSTTYTKMLGVGLAIAVVVDAFLVRALLVPALMTLAGKANWWWPFGAAQRSQRV